MKDFWDTVLEINSLNMHLIVMIVSIMNVMNGKSRLLYIGLLVCSLIGIRCQLKKNFKDIGGGNKT